MGELQVRGPWVAGSYHAPIERVTNWTDDGWFRTGDVVTIDAEGYIKITDRIKDLIKSGGEWISSVDLETALMGHPAVADAAVIAVPHRKRDERPLAVVVLKPPGSRFRQWVTETVSALGALIRSASGAVSDVAGWLAASFT